MEVALTELQLAIIQVLWNRGSASTLEIQDDLRAERKIAQSTIATLLARLEKKNVVARREEGRQHFFRALVDQEEVQRSIARDSARRMEHAFLGDKATMISFLLDAAEFDEDDIERARRVLQKRLREKASAKETHRG